MVAATPVGTGPADALDIRKPERGDAVRCEAVDSSGLTPGRGCFRCPSWNAMSGRECFYGERCNNKHCHVDVKCAECKFWHLGPCKGVGTKRVAGGRGGGARVEESTEEGGGGGKGAVGQAGELGVRTDGRLQLQDKPG